MSLTTKMSRYVTAITERFTLPVNSRNYNLAYRSGGFTALPTVSELKVANTDVQVDVLKGVDESFEQVFNEWTRISHLGRSAQPANANELNSWSYDPVADRILCTVNSTTLVGFIAPDSYDNFEFEVTLRSTNSDDDSIGVCMAFTEVGGVEHTLVAMRTTGGSQTHPNAAVDGGTHRAKLLDVYYDIFHPDRRIDLGSTNGGLMWGDGVVNDARLPSGDIGAGGWRSHPDGCRLKITRTGDIFTIETSDLGSTTYLESATVVVDLNDYPELAKFKGPQRYGYVCYSQNQSTWETHKRPLTLQPIFDLRTNDLWTYVGNDWVLTQSNTDGFSTIIRNAGGYVNGPALDVETGKFYRWTSTTLEEF